MPKHPETHITVSVTRDVHERLKDLTHAVGARSQSQAVDWLVDYAAGSPEELQEFRAWRAKQYLLGK